MRKFMNCKTFKRVMAVSLSLALVWTTGQVAEAALTVAHPPARPLALAYAPSSSLGYVSDSHEVQGRPLVVLIQDLHANYRVQKNIAGVLDFLAARSSSKELPYSLAVEGNSGPMDSSIMALFPDTRIRQAAADYLMRE